MTDEIMNPTTENSQQNIEQKPVEEKPQPKKNNNSVLIVILLLLFAAIIGIWYWWGQSQKIITPQTPLPTPTPRIETGTQKEDSVSSINNDLNALDIGDLEKEFQLIDQDLNSL